MPQCPNAVTDVQATCMLYYPKAAEAIACIAVKTFQLLAGQVYIHPYSAACG